MLETQTEGQDADLAFDDETEQKEEETGTGKGQIQGVQGRCCAPPEQQDRKAFIFSAEA